MISRSTLYNFANHIISNKKRSNPQWTTIISVETNVSQRWLISFTWNGLCFGGRVGTGVCARVFLQRILKWKSWVHIISISGNDRQLYKLSRYSIKSYKKKVNKKRNDLIISGGHECVRLEDEVGDLLGALVGQLPRQQLGLGKLLHVPTSNNVLCTACRENQNHTKCIMLFFSAFIGSIPLTWVIGN